MKRITYRDDECRARFTRDGNKIYCSTQATTDIIAMYEELLESLGYEFDDNLEDVTEVEERMNGCKTCDKYPCHVSKCSTGSEYCTHFPYELPYAKRVEMKVRKNA